MTAMIWSRNSCRWVYRSVKSSCLPTVLSASANFATKKSWIACGSLARTVPIDCATLMTSSTVLFTRTKKEIRMSARMLSRQIRPSRPARWISTVFAVMSISSALCRIGRTIVPVKVTSTFFVRETISALPCSTFWNRRPTNSSTASTMSSTTATRTPKPTAMVSITESFDEMASWCEVNEVESERSEVTERQSRPGGAGSNGAGSNGAGSSDDGSNGATRKCSPSAS